MKHPFELTAVVAMTTLLATVPAMSATSDVRPQARPATVVYEEGGNRVLFMDAGKCVQVFSRFGDEAEPLYGVVPGPLPPDWDTGGKSHFTLFTAEGVAEVRRGTEYTYLTSADGIYPDDVCEVVGDAEAYPEYWHAVADQVFFRGGVPLRRRAE